MTMLGNIIAAMESSRPHNMAAAAASVVAGYLVSSGFLDGEIALPAVFTGLVAGLGNMVNDCFDADIDRINKPRRPIPSGRIEGSTLLGVYLAGTLLVTSLALVMLSFPLLCFILCWEAILYVYARWAKRTPLAGNLLVAAVASSSFVAGAVAAGAAGASLFPFAFAFVFIMGRELIKEAEDVEGDRACGAGTIAVRIGVRKTVHAAALFLLSCALIAPLPALASSYGRIYLLLMEFTVVPGLLITSVIILRSQRTVVLSAASWILKAEMFLGIVAIAAAGL